MKKFLKRLGLTLLSLLVLLSLADVAVSHGWKFKSLIVGFTGGSLIVRPGATVTMGSPIDLDGTFTESAIDFSNISIDHTGSNGPTLIRAGTYASPITNSDEDQSGMIRLYSETSADGTSYDRTIFAHARTTGEKGVFPIAGLAEIGNSASSDGPEQIMAGQFIVDMLESGSKLDSGSFGMFGVWAKVQSASGSVAEAGTKVAAIWLDNEMNGTVSGEEYAIFSTIGVGQADAWAAFETGSNGWEYLFMFDETMAGKAPISTVTPATSSNDATGSLIFVINGTDYYIPYFTLAQD